MLNFLKGIIVGIGGISPGLSGSVLLVILGLYKKTINSIGMLFKNFKDNIKFLFPLVLGFGTGILIFSKIVNFLLNNYEMQTRFAFLGLVIGTIPLFYKEVKKEGFNSKYYIVILSAAVIGFLIFNLNKNLFPNVTNPNIFQSIILGVAVAGSSIVPGVDSAVILSTLGLYELYVGSIADVNMTVLLPALLGLILGAIIISLIMNKLIKEYYTATFSVIFGLFIAIIPNILNETCVLKFDITSLISLLVFIFGFIVSYFLGKVKNNSDKLKNTLKYLGKLDEKTKKKQATN